MTCYSACEVRRKNKRAHIVSAASDARMRPGIWVSYFYGNSDDLLKIIIAQRRRIRAVVLPFRPRRHRLTCEEAVFFLSGTWC